MRGPACSLDGLVEATVCGCAIGCGDGLPLASGNAGAAMTVVVSTASRRRLCLAGRRPSSRANQSRSVSRPISIPNERSAAMSVSTDSPACRSRSRSSRCGSSWIVARLRGCRARSTASSRLDGRMGVVGWCPGSDMVIDGEWYVWRRGGARDTPGARSKRKRLDVGVIIPSFHFVFPLWLSFSVHRLGSWFIEWRAFHVSLRCLWGECFGSDSWPGVVRRSFPDSRVCALDTRLVFGGGRC